MTSTTAATVLARIDELMLDLMRQLVVQADVLRSSTAAASSSTAVDLPTPSQTAVERPAKRAKQAAAKVTPLKLTSFSTTDAANTAESNVSFPTKSVVGIRRFAQMLRVLELIQTNLLQGRFVTKRDIYYQSLHLFANQQASDRIVAQLVPLLGCTERAQLNIVASPRGLVSGAMTMCPPVGEKIECCVGQTTVIPTEIGVGWSVDLQQQQQQQQQQREGGEVERIVLVVEKEAVFKQLLQQRAGEGRLDWSKVVIVTAKGYPDHATRVVLLQLLTASPCVKVVGLFDGDPYGVDIHRQFGDEVEWIGVDIVDFLPALSEASANALVPLRNDERSTAVRLLRSLGDSVRDEHVRARLTAMLLTGYKVEIEAAYEFAPPPSATGCCTRGGIVGYIEYKLCHSAK